MPRLRQRLLFGVATVVATFSFSSRSDAQAPATHEDMQAILRRLNQQEAELQALRRQVADREITPLPPPDTESDSVFHPASAAPKGDVADRLEDVEKQLKKIADAEKKKKEEDALKPTIKVRGRIHADTAWFGQSPENRADLNTIVGAPNGDLQDGSDFRRARIGVQGKAFEIYDYIFEMDFGLSLVIIQDAYVAVNELPFFGSVRTGQFREPFGLENQTSANYITFMERGETEVFDPARNIGTGAFNCTEDQDITWAYGVFRTAADAFGADVGDEGELAFTTRVTWLPFYDEPSDGRYWMHFGGAFRQADTDEGLVRFAGLPEIRMTAVGEGTVPFFVDTGGIAATDFQEYGLEWAWVNGPLSLQAEFACANVIADAGGTQFYHSGYAYVSYFLTGEHRPYERQRGRVDRVKPFTNFFCVRAEDGSICHGLGAWEVAARWSYVNLDESPNVGAGTLNCYTLGLNWYLTPYFRTMANITFAELDNVGLGLGTSEAQVYSMRAQFDW